MSINREESQLNIVKTTNYCLEKLRKSQIFQVHSVYRKTINLQADGRLLAIQAAGSPLSPVSMITDLTREQMEMLPVFPGQMAAVTDSHLVFLNSQNSPVFAFRYDQSQIYDLALDSISFESSSWDISAMRTILEDILSHANTSGLDLVFADSPLLEENLIMTAAKNRIQEALSLLTQEEYKEASKELVRLIGLGIGLTPSGDDFTTGILAGLILFGLQDHPFAVQYKKQVASHLFDTNDISRTFLQAALDGQFSSAVQAFSQIKKEDLREPSATASMLSERFLAIGHSSGIDTLCGIYFVFRYLYKAA